MGACLGCCPIKVAQQRNTCQKKISRSAKTVEETSRLGVNWPKSVVHVGLVSGQHEMLEMEQKTNIGPKTSGNSTRLFPSNIAKPSKLGLRNLNVTGEAISPTDAMMPLLQSENSLGDSCSHTGSQGWEHLGSNATPGSSVDLEWENEIGLTPPPPLNANEELKWAALTETTNNTSWQSSPVSNGLEWDGDFATVEISTIISDTQHLIDSIEETEPTNP